jgi:hypothetical protein
MEVNISAYTAFLLFVIDKVNKEMCLKTASQNIIDQALCAEICEI